MSNNYDYDAIIIGAGISGLVCGCYLAKAGIKTLILEKQPTAGGYCSSFIRKDYRFDTSIHYIGGVRRGSLATVLNELELDKLLFKQIDPSDRVLLPDSETRIRANPLDTLNEFKESFSEDSSNLISFFDFIRQNSYPEIIRKIGNLTFKELLDSYFQSINLKASVDTLLLGNMGLPSSEISAITGIVFFREFLLDPGYYPEGGFQKFADNFVDKFKFYGGKIFFSDEVKAISAENNRILGVITEKNGFLSSKYVVSSIDTTLLFKKLIKLNTPEKKIVDKLIPSGSIFSNYLGLNKNIKKILGSNSNIWIVSTQDIQRSYRNLKENIDCNTVQLLMMTFPTYKDVDKGNENKSSIEIFTPAPFNSKEYWQQKRIQLSKVVLDMAEKIIPDLRSYIDLEVTATPQTFYKYTYNRDGAAFGWASNKIQTVHPSLSQKTSIGNLFLAGHWITLSAGQSGVSTVALSGKKAAGLVIETSRKNR